MLDVSRGSMKKEGSSYVARVDLWPLVERANYLALMLMQEEGLDITTTHIETTIENNNLVITIGRQET